MTAILVALLLFTAGLFLIMRAGYDDLLASHKSLSADYDELATKYAEALLAPPVATVYVTVDPSRVLATACDLVDLEAVESPADMFGGEA